MKIKTPVRPTPALQGKKERKKNQTFKIAPQFFTRQEIYSDLLNVAAGYKRVFFGRNGEIKICSTRFHESGQFYQDFLSR